MAETPRPPSDEEKAKFLAEAARAEAEARKADAEAAKANAEATKAQADAEVAMIATRRALREETDRLSANEFHRIYHFTSEVSSSSVDTCMKQLDIWRRKSDEPIEIVFTSPGGSVISGMVLFDHIQMIRRDGIKFTTGTLGMAASMAGILLQAGDVRWMGREAWILLHEGSFGAVGTVAQVEDCVPPDMPVLTSDLIYVPAGDLAIGDKLLAFDEEHAADSYRKYRIAEVTANARGIRECVTVVTDTGDHITVSARHPFLVRNSATSLHWKRAQDLNPGHDLLTVPFQPMRAPDGWESGWVAGLLDGDGSLANVGQDWKQLRLNFGQNAGMTFDHYVQTLSDDGFDLDIRDHQYPFRQANLKGGLQSVIAALSRYRPPRLLDKFPALIDGAAMMKGMEYRRVSAVLPAGPLEVVLLGTSTGTFIGQGYAMHNTVEWVKKISKRIAEIFAARSKMSTKYIISHWRRKDWWLDSDAALKLGIVDELR